ARGGVEGALAQGHLDPAVVFATFDHGGDETREVGVEAVEAHAASLAHVRLPRAGCAAPPGGADGRIARGQARHWGRTQRPYAAIPSVAGGAPYPTARERTGSGRSRPLGHPSER